MKRILHLIILIYLNPVWGQQKSDLTIEKIMRDPKWMGTSPENIMWGEFDGHLYFRWNPENQDYLPLYRIDTRNQQPKRQEEEVTRSFIQQTQYNQNGNRAVYIKNGDVFVYDLKTRHEKQLTATVEVESGPHFSTDEDVVFFKRGNNVYSLPLVNGELKQLTNFVYGNEKKKDDAKLSDQNQWLKENQLALFDVLNDRKRKIHTDDSLEKLRKVKPLRELPITENEVVRNVFASPNLAYVAYIKYSPSKSNRNTIVPNYVTESGYTEDMQTRNKVGDEQGTANAYLYDIQKDTVLPISTANLAGIKEVPAFYSDYPAKRDSLLKLNKDRTVNIGGIYWNPRGDKALVTVYAQDHKDRWLALLNLQTGILETLDRQHDDAWIAGPGIGGSWGGGNIGWINDEQIYFQSEKTGYSHLYSLSVETGSKKQLTNGRFEVQDLLLSKDKKTFYLTANKEHPGITHFYSMPVNGGSLKQITSMKGGNEVTLSPDEKWLAIRFSTSNTPWELYLQENKPGAKAIQVTESRSDEFKAYPWRTPEVISFANRYQDSVYARLYRPKNPKENNPAVIFVHGAGYLQNVHYWWSSYFREYMFHNLLTDLGYTVLDIDYTASAGYGRDHRTGIYRHMGGKDLSDQVDGAKLLVDRYGVNPKNIGIYGGSYGGFITLMALFTQQEVFTAGGALRSVTDWAHYNHGYTSNILNEPVNDPKAYQQSSPINFAKGLKGHLLMCHGMVDVNVHFQDIVRLSQRLIELGKDDWELAVYPVEDHGFVEPSSWTDEYKRILKLFEEKLTNK
ncbi:prolyl oligopeptidase family serine peptidase [Olivibacter sp. CPCC 100613]|uniref:S9 family peptidase n=1 Tax=Olivibacter sp. CPCC 100613 TaxID=3079931 RepID=UPI002FFBE235